MLLDGLTTSELWYWLQLTTLAG